MVSLVLQNIEVENKIYSVLTVFKIGNPRYYSLSLNFYLFKCLTTKEVPKSSYRSICIGTQALGFS